MHAVRNAYRVICYDEAGVVSSGFTPRCCAGGRALYKFHTRNDLFLNIILLGIMR